MARDVTSRDLDDALLKLNLAVRGAADALRAHGRPDLDEVVDRLDVLRALLAAPAERVRQHGTPPTVAPGEAFEALERLVWAPRRTFSLRRTPKPTPEQLDAAYAAVAAVVGPWAQALAAIEQLD